MLSRDLRLFFPFLFYYFWYMDVQVKFQLTKMIKKEFHL